VLTTDLIESVLSHLPNLCVGVLGDLFLDRYLDLDATLTEKSVETGLDAYQVVRVRSHPGAAGTVINNLVALGVGRIYPIALIGDDGEGYELRRALRAMPAVETGGVMTADGRRTPTYTKPLLHRELDRAGEPPRELNRLDIKNRTPTPAAAEAAVIELLEEAWPQFDALVVLDQVSEPDCGVVTAGVRERLAEMAKAEPEKFVLADSRAQVAAFRNVCLKPNASEAEGALTPGSRSRLTVASELAQRVGRAVFCTDGEAGIWLATATPAGFSVTRVPAYPVTGPIDIVGAGDSTSAGITAAVAAGLGLKEAAAFGNLVASVTIRQLGTTGTASPEQLRQRWREVSAAGG
jgi:rfaE bifunctional protein kinase chain/domain